MRDERPRSGLRIRTTTADRDQPVLGFEYVAVARDDEGRRAVSHREHRLESAQCPVGAPLLGQFDRGSHEMSGMLLKLTFESLEERERVGRAAGKTGKDLTVVQAPDFAGGRLDHDLAEGDLPVSTERNA
jgi:hypothetical protein